MSVPAQMARRLFNVSEYYRMGEAGILHEGDRVELIEGELVERGSNGGAKRLFHVSEYCRMAEAGILRADDRVELIEGEVIRMSPIGSRHAGAVNRLNALFHAKVGSAGVVSVQNPIRLDDYSEPQPDLAILNPRADFYAKELPSPRDVLLIVEVSDTSSAFDRQTKVSLYARAGIAEVWLQLLAEDCVEVYSNPLEGTYRQVRIAHRGERLSPERFSQIAISVEDLLG